MHCSTCAKAELPGQNGLIGLHEVLGDGEAGLLQRSEHVRKNLRDGGHAAHVVERVLEMRVGRVMGVHPGQMRGRKLFVQGDQALRSGLRGGLHGCLGAAASKQG